MTNDDGTRAVERRDALRVAGAAAVGAVMLGGCGEGSRPVPADARSAVPPVAPQGGTIKAAEVPVGGGVVIKDLGVVVTQPTAGTFEAFSSQCTHQGCTVRDVADGLIVCPCHWSKFDLATGEPKAGPATQPLPTKKVTEAGRILTVS